MNDGEGRWQADKRKP